MRKYLRLIGYVRPHLHVLGLAWLCMVATTALLNLPKLFLVPFVDRVMINKPIVIPRAELVPGFILDLTDAINQCPRMELWIAIILTGGSFTIVRGFTLYAQTVFMSDTSHRVIRDMRESIYSKLVGLSLSFYGRNRAGALVSRITYDTGIVRDAISEGLMDAMLQPMELMANIAILLSVRHIFNIPWSFVLMICVVVPLIVYPIMRIGKLLRKISHKSQSAMSDINASLYETISGIRVVQAFGMEQYEVGRFKTNSWNYYRTMMRQIGRNELMTPIINLVLVLCGSWIAWKGGRMVIQEEMSWGALSVFGVALFSLARPVKRLGRLHGVNQTALAAADRIFNTLDTLPDVRETVNPVHIPRIRREIEYRRVSFSYDSDHETLKDVSIKIKAGEIVAIVGPSGSGKSTFVNLLPRFYDPKAGQILIDGEPVEKAAITSVRNQIGIVTQETILFNDSISANIAYGHTDISHESVERAARVANAHDFIVKLPNGYQTLIGDRGFKLSGGEKQRVAIARAVLKNPPILILDEATSSLDTKSERLVQDALEKLMRGRTVLVIAHRLSTVKNADRIVVLEGGVIRAIGRHEELLGQKGLYRKLYELQFTA